MDNLPNIITIARIATVPILVVLGYGDTTGAAYAAFVVFIVASLSDSLDGYLARRYGIVSRMGKWLDPLADKLLVGAALVVLVETRDFPLVVALVIAFREIAVQILRAQIVRGGGDLPASVSAKWKTVTQIVMVSWWLLPWDATNAGHWVLLVLAIATTLWSGAEYFVKAQRVEEVSP